MRTLFICVAAVSTISSAATAQQSQKNPKTVTLSGCVVRDETTPDQYTLTDASNGTTYRVTGKDFREFLGRRVQLDGGLVIKGLKISGGLQPNPNIAGQAGAIDPGRAAVQAATSGSGTRPANDVPEFRVKTIKPTGGTCQ